MENGEEEGGEEDADSEERGRLRENEREKRGSQMEGYWQEWRDAACEYHSVTSNVF